MRMMIMILALIIPLMAQGNQTDIEANKNMHNMQTDQFNAEENNQNFFRHAKRADEYNREAMKRRVGKQQILAKRQKVHKKQQIKNIVRLAVVGGLAYYIGYHQGEKHFNGGMKRRPYLGDKK